MMCRDNRQSAGKTGLVASLGASALRLPDFDPHGDPLDNPDRPVYGDGIHCLAGLSARCSGTSRHGHAAQHLQAVLDVWARLCEQPPWGACLPSKLTSASENNGLALSVRLGQTWRTWGGRDFGDDASHWPAAQARALAALMVMFAEPPLVDVVGWTSRLNREAT
jgi:hypothetical protein